MKYVKCIENIIAHKYIYLKITVGKIYKIEKYTDDFYWIINDVAAFVPYPMELFIDITREIKLEKILNEIY